MVVIDRDELVEQFNGFPYGYRGMVTQAIAEALTICCETCKHGIKGERIGDREYVSCAKPYAGMSNYHTKDWFCGDWKNKNAVD